MAYYSTHKNAKYCMSNCQEIYSKSRKLHNKVVKMIQKVKSSYFKNLNFRH